MVKQHGTGGHRGAGGAEAGKKHGVGFGLGSLGIARRHLHRVDRGQRDLGFGHVLVDAADPEVALKQWANVRQRTAAGEYDPRQTEIDHTLVCMTDLFATDPWRRDRGHGDLAYRDIAGADCACTGICGGAGAVACC
jgi:hypothetical protein